MYHDSANVFARFMGGEEVISTHTDDFSKRNGDRITNIFLLDIGTSSLIPFPHPNNPYHTQPSSHPILSPS